MRRYESNFGMLKTMIILYHPRYFGMRRYESKLISQGKCTHLRYFGMLKTMNSVLIPDILVCVDMSQKSYYTPKPSRYLKGWYECKSVINTPKTRQIRNVLVCVGMSQNL